MKLAWTEIAWNDYLYWQSTDGRMLQRMNDLIKDIKRSPFQGIGKPEPLKFEFAGKWSRRINDEHRLIYSVSGKDGNANNKSVDEKTLIIYQCKYHY